MTPKRLNLALSLRKLSIEQPIVHFREQVMPGIDRIWDELPVGLSNLSTMPLTSLNCQLGEFSLGDDEEREQQDETDPTLAWSRSVMHWAA